MPVFETAAGTRKEIHLPTTLWPELTKAKQAYEDLQREAKVTRAKAVTLRGTRQTIETQAARDLAKAIAEKKGEDAIASRVEKELADIEKQLAACERRMRAIEEALDTAEVNLIEVVDDNRDAWLEDAAIDVESAYAEYREAVKVLAEKRRALSKAHALRSFVRGFPEEVESFKIGQGVLPKLRSQNGAPYTVQQVLDALTEDANPEAPPQVQPFEPLLPRLSSGVDGGVHVPS